MKTGMQLCTAAHNCMYARPPIMVSGGLGTEVLPAERWVLWWAAAHNQSASVRREVAPTGSDYVERLATLNAAFAARTYAIERMVNIEVRVTYNPVR